MGEPILEKPFYTRRCSLRVDDDFFDPEGVRQLQRRLTQPASNRDDTYPVVSASEETITVATDGTFDLKKTLKLITSKQHAANVKSRSLGVVFEGLCVTGLGASSSYQPTLGTLFNPTSIFQQLQTIRHPPVKSILTGFEGAVRPGEMLLVLGSPGSGCSTLLKVLANHRSEYHSVSGSVYYDSLSPEAVAKHYRGDVVYCPEDDVHFPTLTVEETLNFAAKTRAPRNRIDQHTRAQYTRINTDLLTTVFGLKHASHTVVGDASIRGVSGGEKKRVSIAENLASRCLIGAWDNSTRGLDSSTAGEFVRALRISTDATQMATIVSIYQAGEPLYKYFDKVCLIYEGRLAFFGPADKASQYFIDLGFQPVDRQTTADFLVSVTDPTARVVQPHANVPRTADEFAQRFLSSEMGRLNRADIDQYKSNFVDKPELAAAFKQSFRDEKANHTRKGSPFMVSIPMQAKAVMTRRIQIMKGSWFVVAINISLFVFQAIIMGTVFFRSADATSAYFSRGGVLFFALLFAALSSMAEIPALYGQRPIIARHEKAALYHPAIEALALTLVDVPITFGINAVFCVILYFLVGLQRTAAQFFVFFLFVFVMAITMKAWFRTLAAAFQDEATAQTFAGISILMLSIYTGYTIPKPTMIGALRWITYINPLRYGFESVVTNEFRTLNGVCSHLIPSGPGYESVSLQNQVCNVAGSLPGQDRVNGARFVLLSYGFSYSHTWMNFGILMAFCIAFILALLCLTELNISSSYTPPIVLFKRRKAANPSIIPSSSTVADTEKLFGAGDSSSKTSENAAPVGKSVEPMSHVFSWEHLNYVVTVKGKDRILLDDVSGIVPPGKLTALMGESGAGKTTLLNVLADRTTGGSITGTRLIDGRGLPRDFQSQTGYVQQMDTHTPLQTVREALLFSARMRQPISVSDKEKQDYVDKCLQMCGLETYADAMVGSLGIEHRKRTTIGVELAAKPGLLLFLDEPTSGLDSASAWAIMSFLRNLADSGQAILCTIHQPSAELFQVFDRLLLLRKGGQTVYHGEIGPNSATMINYFKRHGARPCAQEENPAEYMLDVIGAGATAQTSNDWHEVWKTTPEVKAVQAHLESLRERGAEKPPISGILTKNYATPWLYQLWQLLVRNNISYWRDPTYLLAKMALNIVGGLFIGFTFFKAKHTQQGVQNQLFSIFMATVLAAPLSNQIQVPFINIRSIYEVRERSSRMYSWTAMLTAQILVELPWNILGSSIFFLCWFWTVGFPTERAGFTYLMYGVMFPLYYSTFAQAVASMAPSADIAALLFSFLFSFVLTFNGVLQPFRQLGWWRWMYRLSPFTYMIEGLLGQALGKQLLECSAVEYVRLMPPAGNTCAQYLGTYITNFGGYLLDPNASAVCTFCPYRTTDQFLAASFNIRYSHHWRDFGLLFAFIAFNIVSVYILTLIFRIRRS